MLLYLTGSKAFNIKVREIAIGRGYKLNEYGIEDRSTQSLQIFREKERSYLSDSIILSRNWGGLG